MATPSQACLPLQVTWQANPAGQLRSRFLQDMPWH